METAFASRFDRSSVGPTINSQAPQRVSALVSTSESAPRILLKDRESAQQLGVSMTTFHELRRQAWFPRPIQLGPRLLRWSRAELEEAVAKMPRQEQASEPAQLRRGRIEAMKRGA